MSALKMKEFEEKIRSALKFEIKKFEKKIPPVVKFENFRDFDSINVAQDLRVAINLNKQNQRQRCVVVNSISKKNWKKLKIVEKKKCF